MKIVKYPHQSNNLLQKTHLGIEVILQFCFMGLLRWQTLLYRLHWDLRLSSIRCFHPLASILVIIMEFVEFCTGSLGKHSGLFMVLSSLFQQFFGFLRTLVITGLIWYSFLSSIWLTLPPSFCTRFYSELSVSLRHLILPSPNQTVIMQTMDNMEKNGHSLYTSLLFSRPPGFKCHSMMIWIDISMETHTSVIHSTKIAQPYTKLRKLQKQSHKKK